MRRERGLTVRSRRLVNGGGRPLKLTVRRPMKLRQVILGFVVGCLIGAGISWLTIHAQRSAAALSDLSPLAKAHRFDAVVNTMALDALNQGDVQAASAYLSAKLQLDVAALNPRFPRPQDSPKDRDCNLKIIKHYLDAHPHRTNTSPLDPMDLTVKEVLDPVPPPDAKELQTCLEIHTMM